MLPCLSIFRVLLSVPILLLVTQDLHAACKDYARQSVQQQEQNILSLCGYRGAHWKRDVMQHLKECATMSERDLQYRLKFRQRFLRQCERRLRKPLRGSVSGQSRSLQLAYALQDAISLKNLRLVQMLVKAGASVNYEKSLPSSPLMHALQKDALHIVRYLLARGANPRRLAPGEASLLIHVLLRKPANHTLLRSLLAAGANPNISGDKPDDEYPLVIAVKQGRYWAVDVLLRYNANPNLYKQRSALQLAVEMDNYPVTRALLKQGAHANLGEKRKLCQGEMALDLAYYYSGERILDLLLDSDALTQQECDKAHHSG